MISFPHFRVSGSAFERGKQLGQLAKQQIVHNIETYKALFLEMAQVKWEAARAHSVQYIPWIERYDVEILEEIKGISEGAEQDLLDLIVLNARSEIITNLAGVDIPSDGCTSMAAVPEMTKSKEMLLGQNWDWNNRVKPGMIVLEINQAPRPTILMVTEAGIVGKIGMNSEGVGVCLNFLGTSEREIGVPIHVVLRGILNSKTLPQAVGQVARLTRGTSANYLIAHKEGEALNVETTPTNYDVLYPNKGWLVHANHFIGPRKVMIQDTARIVSPDTHLRQGRASKQLGSYGKGIDAKAFKRIFRDHGGSPDGICRHGEVLAPDLGRPLISSTVFSIIMNMSQGTFELAVGQPCKTPYKIYGFTLEE
ncbi:C45 family autoproteolytic acyltransferase/hydolase [Aneurinibacillus migulanus]|uniref:Isopenicillin-N N-acyltransferase like protein n=1 Tax=Aneurinibacillus migulanus TaxID=47500 RepID=A0A1G8Y1J4_ANEMI|nr:C45 family peptidase [Aneurinibacillus migulanus]MED0896419.1 C45 family autoproteolytic acyltransferase/hydrolase [Aneurinibacillus migulanus]MED1616078.1 C45 family autoproteolytic acyltransferase/hydrolase [Aneurinibacillus migulanus]MED4729732.1 C45 family autoproteolytic acyltransferase/hydrolase [Aneurinibacillus migulanus]SDJ96577.1 isopenicillin-N N-acyltransferase like protein [Aneurinibacillus migulanus]GED14985.1 acyl-CoA--6-aminopenicillanic acid acyl-transferase [Aneurinibacill